MLVVGCASQPDNLQSSYVSPHKYGHYDCDKIYDEMGHVSNRTGDLYFQLKEKADTDAAQMGIGLVLFWPTLFFLEGGDGVEAQEYSRLKGEYEALRAASAEHNCAFVETPPSPEQIIAAKAEEEKERRSEQQDDYEV